jgi:hypothetical protein
MFQFPWFPLPALCVQAGVTRHDPCRVFPFGDPRIEACLAAPRGLSQPATSFIGFQRLGIHRVPFATCRDDARARYGVLKVRRRTGKRLRRVRVEPDSRAVRCWSPRTGEADVGKGCAFAAFKAAQSAHADGTWVPAGHNRKRSPRREQVPKDD